jgi:hypothetical protein
MAEFSPTAPDRATPRRPRRRWLQFGFATLLKLVALAAVLSAWWAERERLIDRIGRLENDQSVLRIAMGDDDEVWGYPYTDSPFSNCLLPGDPNTAPPSPTVAFGAGSGAILGTSAIPAPQLALSRDELYRLLHAHKGWLAANCPEDQGWQEFLARGEPADDSELETLRTEIAALRQSMTPQGVEVFGRPVSASRREPNEASNARQPIEAPSPRILETPPPTPSPAVTDDDPPREDRSIKVVQQCLPALVKLLTSPDAMTRLHAADLLGQMGSAAAAPSLADAASDPYEGVREAAIHALGHLGPSAKAVVPRLTALLDDGAYPHPMGVAKALLEIDPQADIIPRLVEALNDQRPAVRLGALDLLSSLDASRAAVAAPAIADLLSDKDPRVRSESAKAYSRLAPRDEAVSVLHATLKSEKDHAVRRLLARAIVRLQNGSRER